MARSRKASRDSSSLFLSKLPEDVTEQEVYEHCEQVCGVESIRLSRAAGSATAQLADPTAADEARTALHGTRLRGHELNVRFTRRRFSTPAGAATKPNVFIQPLEAGVSDDELFQSLSAFGAVLRCHIVRQHNTGRSKGFAYATLEGADAVASAINDAGGILIGASAQPSYVREYVETLARGRVRARPPPPPVRQPSEPHTDAASVYVGQLPECVATKQELGELFAEFGRIVSTAVKVQNDPHKRFGFVNYAHPAAAERACAAMHGQLINGTPLFVKRARITTPRPSSCTSHAPSVPLMHQRAPARAPQQQPAPPRQPPPASSPRPLPRTPSAPPVTPRRSAAAPPADAAASPDVLQRRPTPVPPSAHLAASQPQTPVQRCQPQAVRSLKGGEEGTSVFVSGIEKGVSEDDLRFAAEIYGAVSSVRILRDDVTLVSRGLAFVQFGTPELARAACARMNGKLMYGRPVSASLAARYSGDKGTDKLRSRRTHDSDSTAHSGLIPAAHGPNMLGGLRGDSLGRSSMDDSVSLEQPRGSLHSDGATYVAPQQDWQWSGNSLTALAPQPGHAQGHQACGGGLPPVPAHAMEPLTYQGGSWIRSVAPMATTCVNGTTYFSSYQSSAGLQQPALGYQAAPLATFAMENPALGGMYMMQQAPSPMSAGWM